MKCAKVRYRDEIGAKIALASTRAASDRKAEAGEKRRENRVYRCPKCKGYHLTSQTKGER